MSCGKALVEMGRLGKAIGLKGELYLIWHGEKLPEAGQELYLLEPFHKDEAEKLKPRRLLVLRFQKDRPVIRLEGVEDRSAAEKLTGSAVFQPRADLEQPEEDEAFLTDLIGSQIYLGDGSLVGNLDHVEFPANQQLWIIAGADGKEILFPAQPCFIEAFYPEQNKIVISPPPGLLEIYNA